MSKYKHPMPWEEEWVLWWTQPPHPLSRASIVVVNAGRDRVMSSPPVLHREDAMGHQRMDGPYGMPVDDFFGVVGTIPVRVCERCFIQKFPPLVGLAYDDR
jgi:hypothetical protein